MPHTGTPPSKKFRGHDPLGGVKGEVISGLERRFVPGVAAEICRRPYDRPRAETHPPNASMNVCLVNSAPLRGPESWRLFWFFPYPVSLNDPAEFTGHASVFSLAHLPVRHQKYAPNCTRYRGKMEAPTPGRGSILASRLG